MFVPGYRLTPDHQNHCLLLCDCNAFSLSAPKFNKQKKEKKKKKNEEKGEGRKSASCKKDPVDRERGKTKQVTLLDFVNLY